MCEPYVPELTLRRLLAEWTIIACGVVPLFVWDVLPLSMLVTNILM